MYVKLHSFGFFPRYQTINGNYSNSVAIYATVYDTGRRLKIFDGRQQAQHK